MSLAETRPLSDLYREDQRRLAAREFDRIIALHRANFTAHQLIVAAERRNSINELEIQL
jgi:hypothetical protein